MLKSNTPLIVYIALFVLIICSGFFFFSLTSDALLQYDALHYQTIKDKGYDGIEVAFFPLFPLMWSILSLSVCGIAILNACVYFCAVYFLFQRFEFSTKEKVFALLTPGMVFFMVPYTEAFFFATATIVLIGINQRDTKILLFGLLLSVICRPSFTVLLPALLVMELFGAHSAGTWKRMGLYFIVTAIGSCIVAVIQYADTGSWFDYFTVQTVWDNHLGIPTLPLRSWGYEAVIMLDGVALLIGSCSGLILLDAIIRKKATNMSNTLKVSLAYLGGMSLIVLLFRGGSLFSLNRFVFCSPFFYVVLVAFYRSSWRIATKEIVVCFFLLVCYWLLFGSYVHIQTFLRYGALSFALMPLFALKHNQLLIRNWAFYAVCAAMLFVQFFFIAKYLTGNWVG